MVLHQGGGVGPRRRAEAAEILRHPFRGVPPVSTQVQAVPGSGRDAAQPGGEAMGADGWIKAATGVKRDALTGAQGDLHRCAPPLPRCKDLSTLLYPKILRLTTRYKGEKRARFPGGAGAFPNGALRRAAARDLPRSRKRAPCTGAGRKYHPAGPCAPVGRSPPMDLCKASFRRGLCGRSKVLEPRRCHRRGSLAHRAQWKVRLMTSSCCSRDRRLKLTA